MTFGIIGRTGTGMRQVVEFRDRSTGRGTFGANLGRAIVTNGDFTAYVCDVTRPSSQITLGRLVFYDFMYLSIDIEVRFFVLHFRCISCLVFIAVELLCRNIGIFHNGGPWGQDGGRRQDNGHM